MSQNGQTHFKNLAANADHIGTLWDKGLKVIKISSPLQR